MTTLVVEEFKNTLSQTITFNQYRTYHIAAIKIKLLMFNSPSGTFTVSLKSGATTLDSDSFTSSDIKTELDTTDDYAYLYKTIDISVPIKSGTYTLELSHSGYTFSDSSFLGWIKSHENIFNEKTTEPDNFTSNPFDYLIYERVREDLLR